MPIQPPSADGACLVFMTLIYLNLKGPPLTPQTSSINTFLLVAASLQREVTLGDLETAFMQSDKKVAERPKGKLYASIHPGGIPL